MQSVETEVDGLIRRAGSQEQVALLCRCDQAQISRKATRVAAGDASWMEVLRAGQLVALGHADDRVRAAVQAAMERRHLPSGNERCLPDDIAKEIERSSALTMLWVKAMSDGQLTREEINALIVAAEGLRETCDAILRDARALRARRSA
jgi:hypothetical protein